MATVGISPTLMLALFGWTTVTPCLDPLFHPFLSWCPVNSVNPPPHPTEVPSVTKKPSGGTMGCGWLCRRVLPLEALCLLRWGPDTCRSVLADLMKASHRYPGCVPYQASSLTVLRPGQCPGTTLMVRLVLDRNLGGVCSGSCICVIGKPRGFSFRNGWI